MGKSKGTRPQAQKNRSKRQDNDTDDEELYNEVDKFHIANQKITSSYGTKRKSQNLEVLNVEGDISDDEGERVVDDGKFSDDEETEVTSKTNKWGARKTDFYDGSYVDKDLSRIVDDEDEAAAQLEEEDAAARQRVLDAAASVVDLVEDFDEDDEQPVKTQVVETSSWNTAAVKASNKEMDLVLNDVRSKTDMFMSVIRPLEGVLQSLPDGSALKERLMLCCSTYGLYMSACNQYLLMKSQSLASKKANDLAVDEHPMLKHIWKLKEMTEKVDNFMTRNSDMLATVMRGARKGQVVRPKSDLTQVTARKPWESTILDDMVEQGEIAEEESDSDEDNEQSSRRGINKNVEENRGAHDEHKKVRPISKLKKRKQYKDALKKKRSKRPDIAREMNKYEGEKRGIRASTVKSIKIKS